MMVANNLEENMDGALDQHHSTSFHLNADRVFDFRDPEVLNDQECAFDQLLQQQPIVKNQEANSYTLFKHADVMAVICDDVHFSARASKYLFVPHGLDDPEHHLYRQAILTTFIPEKMQPLLPKYREIARALADDMLAADTCVDMQAFAFRYAARVKLLMLGWGLDLDQVCIDWTLANLAASLADDKQQNIKNAEAWNTLVYSQLENTRKNAQSHVGGESVLGTLAYDLLQLRVKGKPIPDAEISSIIRNVNMGIVSSLAFNIGNCIQFLAEHGALQQKIRQDMTLLPEALDEITRIHGALVQSKRLVKKSITIRGVRFEPGEIVYVNWCAANRDPDVFSEPHMFKSGRDHTQHLMYGAGAHECTGIR